MPNPISRRDILKAGLATALPATPLAAQAQERRFEPQPGAWRRFELTTRVEVPQAKGVTRVWLPVPDVQTGYQRTLGHDWSGNASAVRIAADRELRHVEPVESPEGLYQEFAARFPFPETDDLLKVISGDVSGC